MEAARRREARNVTTYRDQNDQNGDLRVFEKPGAKLTQIEDQSNGAGAFPVEKDTAEQSERLAVEVRAVATPGRKNRNRWAAGPAVFRKDVPAIVVETRDEDVGFRREGVQHLLGGPLIVKRERSGRVCTERCRPERSVRERHSRDNSGVHRWRIRQKPAGRQYARREDQEGKIETDGEVSEPHGVICSTRRAAARHRGGEEEQA